jgi:hypothetical protein
LTVNGRNVHLVGSVPLADRDAVFRATGEILGERLKRYPDGETGDRGNWVQWQRHLVVGNPQFVLTSDDPLVINHGSERPYFRVAPGVDPAGVTFAPIGYAENARASYPAFCALRDAGVIPRSARFLVALPTPLAFLQVFIDAADRARVAAAYERRVLAEVAEIAAAIPHQDLAIQWDTVFELLILEGGRQSHIDDSQDALFAKLLTCGNAVPADADLGFHLCYGDMNHRHSIEPRDTALLVETTNALSRGLQRKLDYVHMPVPRDRSDEAYFAPLAGLAIAPETELYLGLVHMTGGEDGIRRRIDAANRVRPDFGIGTECGFGRRPPETIVPLLRLHAAAAEGRTAEAR